MMIRDAATPKIPIIPIGGTLAGSPPITPVKNNPTGSIIAAIAE